MLYLCLVICKDASSARATNKSLDAFGLKAYSVTSLGSALGLLAQWRFDVVLLDSRGFGSALPTMLDELQRRGLPIFVTTDDADEESHVRLMELGATDVLASPVSPRLVGIRLRQDRRDTAGAPASRLIDRQPGPVDLGHAARLGTDRCSGP